MRAQALIFLCLFLASANSRMLRFKNEISMLIDYLRNLQRLEMLSLEKKKQNERRMQSTAQSNHQRMAHESKQMASNDIFLYFRFITKLIHRLG